MNAALAHTSMKKEVVITPAAADEIRRQRDKRGTPDARIRVGVRGGGCTGFTYVFEWADQIRPTDSEFSGPEGTALFNDERYVQRAGGMPDFVEEMIEEGF